MGVSGQRQRPRAAQIPQGHRQPHAEHRGRDFGQIFITDTQRGRIESIVASFTGEYRIFEVVEGVI